MILSRNDVIRYRPLLAVLKDVPQGDLTRIYGHLHAERLQEQWATRYGLKRSTGRVCLRRLRGKPSESLPFRPPGADHDSLWLLNGKPTVYVTQPYHVDIFALVDFCRAEGFTCDVDLWPAWHFPHRVFHVEITTPEGREALTKAWMQRKQAPASDEFLKQLGK